MRNAGIDVVVRCYRHGRFLRECVDSILSQSIGDIRVLVIDNASTDNSLEVASQLAAEDSRIEVVAHPRNVGATASYNEGIDWASAEYFVLLDADDLLAPGCLARALACMEAHREVSFTYGIEAFRLSDGTMQVLPEHSEEAPWRLAAGRELIAQICRFPTNHVGAPTVVRRTSMQKRIGYYRPSLPYTDDLEMWLRLASVGDVGSISTVQGVRRIHSLQMSEDYRSNMVRDFTEREAAFVSFFSNEGRFVPGADAMLKLAVRRLGEHAYWSAVSHLFRGHAGDAAQLLRFCLNRRPSAALIPPVGWLLRMDRPLHRVVQIGRETLGRLKAAARRPGAARGTASR
ncbi:MAG: glycosyltransferase family A protein [Hyphomicrobiaceae bacterium]